MKSYIFELPEKKYDNKGFLKNLVINHIAEKYPFLTMDGIDGPKTETSLQYAGPGDFISLGVHPKYHISSVKKNDWYNGCSNCFNYKCPFNALNRPEKINLLSDFDIAMKKLDEYANSTGQYLDKGYDYKWFGTPVRIYQNFIQIGMTIIPKKGDYFILPEDLSQKEITIINNVIYNINIIVNEAA